MAEERIIPVFLRKFMAEKAAKEAAEVARVAKAIRAIPITKVTKTLKSPPPIVQPGSRDSISGRTKKMQANTDPAAPPKAAKAAKGKTVCDIPGVTAIVFHDLLDVSAKPDVIDITNGRKMSVDRVAMEHADSLLSAGAAPGAYGKTECEHRIMVVLADGEERDVTEPFHEFAWKLWLDQDEGSGPRDVPAGHTARLARVVALGHWQNCKPADEHVASAELEIARAAERRAMADAATATTPGVKATKKVKSANPTPAPVPAALPTVIPVGRESLRAIRDSLRVLVDMAGVTAAEIAYARLVLRDARPAQSEVVPARKLIARHRDKLAARLVADALEEVAVHAASAPQAPAMPPLPVKRKPGRPPSANPKTASQRNAESKMRHPVQTIEFPTALVERFKRMRDEQNDDSKTFLTRALDALERSLETKGK